MSTLLGNVHVSWINDQSAYIALQKEGQTAVALRTLSQSETYTVTSYANRQAQLDGINKRRQPLDELHTFAKRLKVARCEEYVSRN